MTPLEAHYRDILNSAKARLRQMEADAKTPPETRKEVRRIADMIAARIDQQPKEDA